MFEFNLSTDPRGRIFLDPVAFADMDHWHEVARELRNDAPILRVEAEGYEAFTALTRHAEVFEVSRRSDIWHNTQRSMLMPDWLWMFILSLGIDRGDGMIKMLGGILLISALVMGAFLMSGERR